MTQLSDLLLFQNGINADSSKFGKGIKYISVSDILNNDFINYSCIKGLIDIDEDAINHFSVTNGDILFQRSSETIEDIGHSNVYLDSKTAVFGGFVIRGKKISSYHPSFLKFLLDSPNCRKQIIRLGAGAQHYNIGQAELNSVILKLPSIGEQGKIAKLLSLMDKRIEVQRKIIEDMKSLKKAVLSIIFVKETLKYVTLHELIVTRQIRLIKPLELPIFSGKKVYLSTSSIDDSTNISPEAGITYNLRPSRALMYPIKNSVWFAKMKGSVKVFLADSYAQEKYVLSSGFYGCLCISKKINHLWLREVFLSNYFNYQKDRFSEGGTMSGIKDSQLSDIRIPIFESKVHETDAVRGLGLIEERISIEEKKSDLIISIKKYLLSNLFI